MSKEELVKRLKNVYAMPESRLKDRSFENLISDLEAEVIPEPEDWLCGKCDQTAGEAIPEHSRHCPKRKEHDERCGMYNNAGKEEWVCRCGLDKPKTPEEHKHDLDSMIPIPIDDKGCCLECGEQLLNTYPKTPPTIKIPGGIGLATNNRNEELLLNKINEIIDTLQEVVERLEGKK